MKRKNKTAKGITLVALIITIIVLLILVAVTIRTVQGDGIIAHAHNAVDSYKRVAEEENQMLENLFETVRSGASGSGSGSETGGINASAIATAEDKSSYYGKTVTNYECTNSSAVNAWRIFYADSNNIYLITDDYIPYASIPKSSGNHTLNESEDDDYTSAAYFTNVLSDYTGSANITDTRLKNLNKDYFVTKNYSSTYSNMQAVAYMMDTNAWSGFAGAKADYAIGGPTIELLMKSYSEAHKVDYMAQATNATGYKISNDGGTSWDIGYDKMLSTDDDLYVITDTSGASGYWISSPNNNGRKSLFIADYGGYVANAEYDNFDSGFRPLVCLNSNVSLEQQEDGSFRIK